ncbi:MAG: GDSL-type esterase/lipase family protein [Desulfuromusa sp.]|nr:GDSL-type esterase/lipase family protein [Desulfuromusa sp.]
MRYSPKPENSEIANRFNFLHIFLLLLFTFPSLCCLSTAAEIKDPNPLRFQKEIKRFNWQDAKNSYPEQAILFTGSSSIYSWKTAQEFSALPVINRGIASAQISDLNYYYDVVIEKYKPARIIFYCGDNDVAAGKSTDQILADFKIFTSRLSRDLPQTSLLFLAIKPSPLRWQLWEKMSKTNHAIKDYCKNSGRCTFLDTATPLLNAKGQPDEDLFAKDGLHLSSDGYNVWNNLLTPCLMKDYNQKL